MNYLRKIQQLWPVDGDYASASSVATVQLHSIDHVFRPTDTYHPVPGHVERAQSAGGTLINDPSSSRRLPHSLLFAVPSHDADYDEGIVGGNSSPQRKRTPGFLKKRFSRSHSHYEYEDNEERKREERKLASPAWHDEVDTGAMKGRLKAAWNNVRYGWTWKHRSSFNHESPIWLLGRLYHSKAENHQIFERTLRKDDVLDSSFQDFFADFASKLWFTYRVGFSKLDGSGSQSHSDCGWGCMLRTAQMVVAQALVMHLLGRDWSVFDAQTYDSIEAHRKIIRFFGDSPRCPLSLHSLIECGANNHGKAIGDWYGPGSAALLLRDVLSGQTDPILSQLAVYVARDCAVVLEDVYAVCAKVCEDNTEPDCAKLGEDMGGEAEGEPEYDLCESPRKVKELDSGLYSWDTMDNDSTSNDWTKALILLVPLRLGTDSLNPVYIPHLKTVLASQHCVGIMGGKPKHSMYFVGWHGESLVYLDPHFCQDFEDTERPGFSVKSFHCHWPRKLPFVEMDPSCALAFYCRDERDFDHLLRELSEVVNINGVDNQRKHPLFSVIESMKSAAKTGLHDLRVTLEDEHSQACARQHGFELL